METGARCPECGADWSDGTTCQDHFDQMLYWEMEDMEALGIVHHLMVLSYHLQHPSLYSPDGLTYAKGLLVDFVERGVTPQDKRHDMRDEVDSGNRKFKIKGKPGMQGAYGHPVEWTMTAADVVGRGMDDYVPSVKTWAGSILDSLRASDNI